MTSGGMTAGAVPLSGMYASALGADAGEILTRIAPATVLGNCVAIVFGGLANNLGEKRPSLTGNGRLVNDGTRAPERIPMNRLSRTLSKGLNYFPGILCTWEPSAVTLSALCRPMLDDYSCGYRQGNGDFVRGAGGRGQTVGTVCHPQLDGRRP